MDPLTIYAHDALPGPSHGYQSQALGRGGSVRLHVIGAAIVPSVKTPASLTDAERAEIAACVAAETTRQADRLAKAAAKPAPTTPAA